MFSIILPVYNGEKFIDSAIKSVFAQKNKDWELIIVNDGSTDNTLSVIEKYAQNPAVTIISQTNHGVSVERNNGISHAKGSHIAFLDADDIWHENHLEVMADLIKKYPEAGLYGTFTKAELVNGEEITQCSFFKNRDKDVLLEDFFEEYHKDKSAKMFTVITTCVKKEAALKVGGFPENCPIGEDLELSLKIAAYYTVALSRVITATYKKVNSTATKTKSFDTEWKFFDTVNNLYMDNSIPLEKRQNLKKVMQWFNMRRLRHYIINNNKKKAWKLFFTEKKDAVKIKDNVINIILLLLPVFLVRKIFEVRWRGQA